MQKDAKSERETMDETGQPPKIGALDIFLAFAQISISGFGGVLFWARRVLVEQRRWLSDREFVDLLALGQLLPGPNVFNVAIMIGDRYAGLRGVFAATAGFMGVPFLIVIGIAMLYERYETLPLVQSGLSGMSAVAVGLLIANGIKMAMVLPRHWRPWLFGLLAFAGVGALRWPLISVLAVLAPLAVATAWRRGR